MTADLSSAVDAYSAESERTVALAEARLKWIEGNKVSYEDLHASWMEVLLAGSS